MYYYNCTLNNEPVVFYHPKELKDEDFKIIKAEKVKEIGREELDLEPNSLHPILSFDDFILRTFNRKTNTHKLGLLNINSFKELSNEYSLIQEKKSKLSHSEREIVSTVFESLV